MLLKKTITFFIAGVWFANGFFCKLLNLVPRHQQIVAQILGNDIAGFATKAIGAAELLMCIWVLSGFRSGFCAAIQVIIIIAMNILEFCLVPQLLLFGRLNIVFALLFCCLILYKEYKLPAEKKI